MTAQATDSVFWRGEEYDLVAVSGGPLFEPPEHGIQPVMLDTSCWRGYVVKYAATERLAVVDLVVGLSEADRERPPTLQGRAPRANGYGGWRYGELSLPVPFTGGMLIGGDFIRELYVHMGYPPAWKFARVHELVFDAGLVSDVRDISVEVAGLRERLAGHDVPSSDANSAEILRFVERTFSLEYPRLKPRKFTWPDGH